MLNAGYKPTSGGLGVRRASVGSCTKAECWERSLAFASYRTPCSDTGIRCCFRTGRSFPRSAGRVDLYGRTSDAVVDNGQKGQPDQPQIELVERHQSSSPSMKVSSGQVSCLTSSQNDQNAGFCGSFGTMSPSRTGRVDRPCRPGARLLGFSTSVSFNCECRRSVSSGR